MATLYFDGCSKGNPGPAGSGAIIKYESESYSEYIGISTNNIAEYKGLILGLKECKKLNLKYLTIKGDSMLIINHMIGKYKVKAPHLLPLYNEAKDLIKEMNVTFHYIPREENKESDFSANYAVKQHCVKPIFEFY